MTEKIPLLEFDPTREAIIEPSRVVKPKDVPEHCVITFFADVVKKFAQEYPFKKIAQQKAESGVLPVWEFEYEGKRIAAFQTGVGAPLAAGMLEELIARGVKKFVVCGSCGVLDSDLPVGQVIVPTAAIRDEGTSYHYLPPSREVEVPAHILSKVVSSLDEDGIPHIQTKVWTTDAIYRETRARFEQRKKDGCLAVEMEASALLAVAQFRNVELGYLLYGGDDLAGDKWDSRSFVHAHGAREKLFWLAVKACLKL